MNPDAIAPPLPALHALGRVLNAAGPYTPVGVSRSASAVAQATAWALQQHLPIAPLQTLVGRELAAFGATEAGTVVHCAAAGITLCVAAALTGRDPDRMARLPDTDGLARDVVVPAAHLIDYGHPLATDIRLAGARVRACGEPDRCTLDALREALAAPGVAALLLVASRLVRGPALDLGAACAAARAAGVPVFIDAAAQDLRVRELSALRPTALVLSAQKYLAAPTAGLVLGEADFIEAVDLQQRGIGRAMKPSKEALVGVLAALAERSRLDLGEWRAAQAQKTERALQALHACPGLQAQVEPDPLGAPFARVRVQVLAGPEAARRLAAALKRHDPAVWVMEHGLPQGLLRLELVGLSGEEVDTACAALRACAASLG